MEDCQTVHCCRMVLTGRLSAIPWLLMLGQQEPCLTWSRDCKGRHHQRCLLRMCSRRCRRSWACRPACWQRPILLAPFGMGHVRARKGTVDACNTSVHTKCRRMTKTPEELRPHCMLTYSIKERDCCTVEEVASAQLCYNAECVLAQSSCKQLLLSYDVCDSADGQWQCSRM
jgi:hypothetical protein